MARRPRNTGWPLIVDPALTVVLILIAAGLAVSFLGA